MSSYRAPVVQCFQGGGGKQAYKPRRRPVSQESMAPSAATGPGCCRRTSLAPTKFRPQQLPATLVSRSALHDRLTAGAGQRLTTVVGSAGAGKSVLLAGWAAAPRAGLPAWV